MPSVVDWGYWGLGVWVRTSAAPDLIVEMASLFLVRSILVIMYLLTNSTGSGGCVSGSFCQNLPGSSSDGAEGLAH